MLKQNKGITLVALVVTIIVLLILAGVSISLVVGQNGVLSQAQNSSKKTAVAQAQEDVEMALSSAQGDFIDTWNTNSNATFKTFLNGTGVFESYYTGSGFKSYTAGKDKSGTDNANKSTVVITVNGQDYSAEIEFNTTNNLGATIGKLQ